MSRSNYSDDYEYAALWSGAIKRATEGKRGQQFFRELVSALDAMPVKRLIRKYLVTNSGEVCAMGALGKAKGINLAAIDPDDAEAVAAALNIAPCLAREVAYYNDEEFDGIRTPEGWKDLPPEGLWQKMRDWAAAQIQTAHS